MWEVIRHSLGICGESHPSLLQYIIASPFVMSALWGLLRFWKFLIEKK